MRLLQKKVIISIYLKFFRIIKFVLIKNTIVLKTQKKNAENIAFSGILLSGPEGSRTHFIKGIKKL